METKYIIDISAKDEKGKIGVKGRHLQELVKAGFKVPITYCLLEDAYHHFVDHKSLPRAMPEIDKGIQTSFLREAEKSSKRYFEGHLPNEIRDELNDRIVKGKLDAKWAVRSSSNLEDLVENSFAGLYDTYLNVGGIENLIEAIRKCWASLWSERAVRYRNAKGMGQSQAAMAVLIQEMVPAIYSGVIFTADPVSRDPKRMIFEYCSGLGDQLVSGRITPFSLAIDKSSMAIQRLNGPTHRDFGHKEILALARTALEIEKHFNGPQDIEWAFDGKKFYILQTRPIVASKRSKKIKLEEIWTRANVGEVLPDAVTPLTWSVFCETLMPHAFSEGGNKAEDVVNASRGVDLLQGRVYIRIDKFLDSFCYLPFVNPSVLERGLGVMFPQDAEDYEPPQGLKVRLAQVLFLVNALRFWPRISNLIGSLPTLPGESIGEAKELIKWTSCWFAAHLKCTAYAMGAFGGISRLWEMWISEKRENLLPQVLIGNADLQTAAQGMSLRGLAKYVCTKPELKVLLQTETAGWGALQKIHSTPGGPEFLNLFNAFMKKNGARTAGEFELAIPRWREDPSFPMEVVRKFLQDESPEDSEINMEKRRQVREKALEEIRKDLKPWQKWLLDRLLVSFGEFSTLRENVKYRLMEGFGLLRQCFLNIGEELAKRGILSVKEDVFFLTYREIAEVQKENKFEMSALISSRKEEWTRWKSQSVADLVVENHHILKREEKGLRGLGCSPGIAEGLARVLIDISESKSLKAEEILVTSHTDPGWTPLFLLCKGVITETGGFLSHGATVAREYGIPAIVGVRDLLSNIQTGDWVRMDGTSGAITIRRRKPD